MDLEIRKSFHITTFGCQMNEHDSETIAGMLSEMGFSESSERKDAGVVIINTCSVRDNADKRFFGTLGQLKRRKENGENFVMCVCGCMMQQQHVIDTIKQKYPWVDIIFGTHNIHQFPEILQKVIAEKQKLIEVWEDGGDIVENLPAKRLFRHKAFVNIMFGCNNFCTYCIVPYTRGRERSRKPEEIIKEVRNLAADGVKEITLLGQNVNSYRGEGQKGIVDFPDLIYMLNEIEGISRIRFMTSHPKDLSDKLIEAFGKCHKLCRSIHLPVQSGSSRVLEKMNRKYTKEDYLLLVDKIRKAVPDISISTDIIVGFPGETEEDFQETLSLCEKVRFDSAFTFLYSVRKGTPAEQYEDQIPEDVKHHRFNRLVDTVNNISAEKNAEYVGRCEELLVDGKSKRSKGDGLEASPAGMVTLSGRTSSFKLVNFFGKEELIGNAVEVVITSSNTFSLVGKIK